MSRVRCINCGHSKNAHNHGTCMITIGFKPCPCAGYSEGLYNSSEKHRISLPDNIQVRLMESHCGVCNSFHFGYAHFIFCNNSICEEFRVPLDTFIPQPTWRQVEDATDAYLSSVRCFVPLADCTLTGSRCRTCGGGHAEYNDYVFCTNMDCKYHRVPINELDNLTTPMAVLGAYSSDPRFDALLHEIAELHDKKAKDYGVDEDPLANVRASATFNVPPWLGAIIRLNDKITRIGSFARKGNLANESLEDSLMDIPVYGLIALQLYRETK